MRFSTVLACCFPTTSATFMLGISNSLTVNLSIGRIGICWLKTSYASQKSSLNDLRGRAVRGLRARSRVLPSSSRSGSATPRMWVSRPRRYPLPRPVRYAAGSRQRRSSSAASCATARCPRRRRRRSSACLFRYRPPRTGTRPCAARAAAAASCGEGARSAKNPATYTISVHAGPRCSAPAVPERLRRRREGAVRFSTVLACCFPTTSATFMLTHHTAIRLFQ